MAEGSDSLPSLPEEIIHYGILPRLPAKALIRLQCVSRGWLHLISGDPHFSLAQSRLGGALASALLLPSEQPPLPPYLCRDTFAAGFQPLAAQFGCETRPFIVASCAGFLLILCIRHGAEKLYVGNPAVKAWSPVPLHDGWDVLHECQTGLAVYEADGAVRYELVDPFLMDGDGELHGEHEEVGFRVFSSATGLWALSEESVTVRDWAPLICSRACVGGRLFWWGGAEVVWFDVREALGGTLPAPPDIREWRKSRMGEWDGRLSFMEASVQDVIVWSWDGMAWQRMRAIELPLFSQVQPHVPAVNVIRRLAVFGFAAGFVMLCMNGELYSFAVVTGKVRAHGSDPRLLFGPAFPYANSLLSLPAIPAVE